jgi:FAD/FMN-containing dehydrogenase
VNTVATDVHTGLPVESLRDQLTGRVILPTDSDYEKARIVMRGDIDDHPALIVRVANAQDIALAIAFARNNGLELAVRSGGHSSAGHSTTEGGLVIDLRDMRALDVDPGAGTMHAETGLTALEVTAAAWEHNMAIGFGDTGSVGIGGITLGGGVGYAARKYGLTIDNLLEADIVLADGSVITVSETEHPDLFWAIRGGGGNFGVVTRFKYQLHGVPSFVGGMLILPATADAIAGFIKAAEEAPEELGTIANVMNCPPMPFLPEDVVGKLVILAFIGYFGADDAAGVEAIKPFQSLAQPLADFLKPMPYPEMYPPEDESYRPLAIDHTFFMESVDKQMAQTIVDRLEASDSPLRAVQLRVLGGATARVPVDATAFAHRDKKIMAVAVNFYEGEADYAKRAEWLKQTVAALDQGVPGAYVNFIREDADEDAARAAYPDGTWDRLAQIKARYDPDNVFRLNQNVPPAPSN